jgi:hypothetical protein
MKMERTLKTLKYSRMMAALEKLREMAQRICSGMMS